MFDEVAAGDELGRLQVAFGRAVEEQHPRPIEGIADGTRPRGYFDTPALLSPGAELVDLRDHPSRYGCLRGFAEGEVLPMVPLSCSARSAGTYRRLIAATPPGRSITLVWPEVPYADQLTTPERRRFFRLQL